MRILQNNLEQTGWITAIIEGRWVQAKVFDEPSRFGVNGGRVSKLSIGLTSVRIEGQNFFNQMAYHYDRGLDFDNLPDGVLEKVLAELEALPKAFT